MILLSLAGLTSFNIKCGGSSSDSGEKVIVTPVEVFTEDDRPVTVKLQTLDLTKPWGYERSANAKRLYPIVVNGCWGEGEYFSEDVRKKYPSFYLDFNNYSTESDGEMLAGLLDQVAVEGYRIDPDRIYLTGFSQGGSGSFKLVRGMLAKGKLFAAIIRVAGQSESVLADKAVAQTSLWYHIGLADDAVRVQIARDTYSNLKSHTYNSKAAESVESDSITGYSRTTKTLMKDGIAVVKMSEYTGMGHDPGPCYKDPALFDWLFNQSLSLR